MLSVIRLSEVSGSDPDLRAALMAAALPTDDVEDEGRVFFKVTSEDEQTIGFSGIERCLGDVLLRSVVILRAYRGRGIGHNVVEATLRRLKGVGDVYLATTTAAPFFSSMGFVEVPRDSVPAAVLATRQLSSICPSSATIMKLIKPPT
ncbi:acetyltransferase [Rhizobium leguminosarum bv. trifolii CB782]|uniref:Arsenic resistance N-acetyltransferase ArsN2 n=1 Tax=Rhizobium hidalgonense TaxID=1538159 RepID=A0AAJ2LQN4_9HYPH|nr:arsenic resistance N-acetyltransferase ArsN2 [Rhizobium hidalgonense]AHG44450.1 acetyltransferase [Rhizobium leguminosarum bv. trifolii CB782]MDR9777106.1 arsenic resistance N-acetyltransferase ArsN2 [Rhizobium hidalgonense]MDR9823430.1 arsenic resistance N-acetyltransferase ArsN2 [Rhizobium hidalgonense]